MGSVRMWRVVVATVVAIESALLLAAAVAVLVALVVSQAGSLSRALSLAVMTAIGGVGIGAVALGLYRGQRWSRVPAALWQVLQASVAVPALGSAWTVPAAISLVLGAVVVAGVVQSRLFETPRAEH